MFKFESAWLMHPLCGIFLRHSWKSSTSLSFNYAGKMTDLRSGLLTWRRKQIGNIQVRIKEVQNKLSLLPFVLTSQEQIDEQIQLEKTLKLLDQMDDAYWRQRSKVHWFQLGDRCTKFFHTKTLIRRRWNRIPGIQNSDGSWSASFEDIQPVFLSYFRNLYSQDSHSASQWVHFLDLPSISIADQNNLSRAISKDEVQITLFSMKPDTAPGPDGFPPSFFKSLWPSIREDLYQFTLHIFESLQLPPTLNHIILTLIPKHANACKPDQFRPISLCNTLLKLVTKLIATRSKPFLPMLTNETQAAFVKGRTGLHNSIMVQEILHSFWNKKGKTGYFMAKLDIRKAFDSINWNFVEIMLHKYGFPASLIQLIMVCISSATFSINLNGQLSDNFAVGRGIRQGCPLSPCIFILCSEAFSSLMKQAVAENKISGFKAATGGPTVSHLMFADDLLVCGLATEVQIRNLLNILQIYHQMSGQCINRQKSKIFFSRNVPLADRNKLCSISEFSLGSPADLYLGIPMDRSNKFSKYDGLINKFQDRLASWKSNLLSTAGRTVLIKSTLNHLANHSMALNKFPLKVVAKLDMLQRNFGWAHQTKDHKRIHFSKWETIKRPKLQGGLGIRDFGFMNEALLLKLSWSFIQEKDKLWVRFIKAKYKASNSFWTIQPSSGCSLIWKNIMHYRNILLEVGNWQIRSGSDINVWKHKWILDRCGPPILNDPVNFIPNKVDDLITDGSWNLRLLKHCFDKKTVQRILATPICNQASSDSLVWPYTSSGQLNAKSAYQFFSNRYMAPSSSDYSTWKLLWHPSITQVFPPKLITFIWKICSLNLPTNEAIAKRCPYYDHLCKFCLGAAETTEHMFLSYPRSRSIWLSSSLGSMES